MALAERQPEAMGGQLGWPLESSPPIVVPEAEQAIVISERRLAAIKEGLSLEVSEQQLAVATVKRPKVAAPQQVVHKELQFDSRYGWTYDKVFDPAEVAQSNGRGRFAVGSLLAVSLRLSVAMVALLEEASCKYTVRGAKYARNTLAGRAAKRSLARRAPRALRAAQPSRADFLARKQGLRRPRKELASPLLESSQNMGLPEPDRELEPRALPGSAIERTPEAEKPAFQLLGAPPEVPGLQDTSEDVSTDKGRAIREGGEVAAAAQSAAGKKFESTASAVNRMEAAEAKFAEEARTQEKVSARPVDAESHGERRQGSGAQSADGSLRNSAAGKAERKWMREARSLEERRRGEERMAKDERGIAEGKEQPRHLVVEMAARGGAEPRGGQLRADVADGFEDERRDALLGDVSMNELGASGHLGGKVVVAGERRSAQPEASCQPEKARADSAGTRGPEKEGPEVGQEETGREHAGGASVARSGVEDEGVGTSAERSAFTIWRAPETMDYQTTRHVHFREAERFERGYREGWIRGQVVLEKEKRKLRSQLGKRGGGRESFHRFLGVS